MAILRCTKKLLTELRAKPADIMQSPSDLNGWHANLLRIDRRKCILFTHDKSLYSFLVTGLNRSDFQNIGEVFRQNLLQNLTREGVPRRQIELFVDDIREIEITKTNNRSVLGSMNDLAFQLKYTIDYHGGLLNTDLAKLNSELNRTPMGAIEYVYSINELNELLKNTAG